MVNCTLIWYHKYNSWNLFAKKRTDKPNDVNFLTNSDKKIESVIK